MLSINLFCLLPFLVPFLPEFAGLQSAGEGKWRNWKTGEEISREKADKEPLLINTEDRIVINGRALNGTVPELVKLYFDGGKDDAQRQMVLHICAQRHHCNVTLCFVGQMDPANGRLNSQFHLQNNVKGDSEIAMRCKEAQGTAWKGQFPDKVLHGVQVERRDDHLWLSASTNEIPDMFYAPQCADVRLGDKGILEGHLAGRSPNGSELVMHRAVRGFLLSMERATTALAFDMLAGIPQGGQLGIIGQKGCDAEITLTGIGLATCLGKQCEGHKP